MRRLPFLCVLSLGCTQILGLDDAVVVPGARSVSVPTFEATLVDGGVPDEGSDTAVLDASELDAPLADTHHKPD